MWKRTHFDLEMLLLSTCSEHGWIFNKTCARSNLAVKFYIHDKSAQCSKRYPLQIYSSFSELRKFTFQIRLHYLQCYSSFVFTLRSSYIFKRTAIWMAFNKKNKFNHENFLQLSTTNKTPCTVCQEEIPQWTKTKKVVHQ